MHVDEIPLFHTVERSKIIAVWFFDGIARSEQFHAE
jgi:hypothetical protein